jgi:hypothetical protein
MGIDGSGVGGMNIAPQGGDNAGQIRGAAGAAEPLLPLDFYMPHPPVLETWFIETILIF